MSTQRAKDLFLAALDRPAHERVAFVNDVCGDDAALRTEVESLLQFHDAARDVEADRHAPSQRAVFTPGEVFAGRYRMVDRIGSGGMGDVWRADDLVLETPVALKVIESASPAARERIFSEVRLARQITHPAVCRVFDVGESDGVIFFSMELVRGEDLAALLRRVGRLPQEKVVEIGRQLCAGIAAAHAQGVLHRDLKPANILIDNDGFVRISDFGIAISRTEVDRHGFTGTPAYMAPEQRAPGMRVSERTDVYALGLVLYDLLVGGHIRRRGDDDKPLPPPSMLVTNVDPRLDRLIMAAVSPDPSDRPSSVLEMAAVLSSVAAPDGPGGERGVTPGSRWGIPAWIAGSVLAAVVVIVVVASSFIASPGARTLTERDTIVLADFENTTGDPVFDGTLKVALAVALEQSPFLKVFPDERAQETLRLMERSPDEGITRSVAREIAMREQLKALLTGSIARLGQNYVIAVEAINAQTGDVMAREQAEAASKEQVLTSLGAAISNLRQKLGESLASVQRFDVPLARATTASLDALHAYSLALEEGREVPRLESIPHLKRAIELDPTFAMAHAFLAAVYANTGQSTLAQAFAKHAFDLRDRVSDRERFFISWRYYRDGLQAWDKALELARSWTATYPREAFAFNGLGIALMQLGQWEASVQPLREAIRLDPRFVPPYGNLAASLLALDHLDEARAILQQAAERKLNFAGASRLSFYLAFAQGDSKTMAREVEASIGVRPNSAFGWQADAAAAEGRVKDAHEHYRRGIQMALHGNFTEVAAHTIVEDAELHATVGQCVEALDELSEGLALARDNVTLGRAGRVFALCGAAHDAASLSSELVRRFPDATLTVHVSVPVIAAAAAIQQGQPGRAVEVLEPVRPYDRAPSAEFWPTYLRGEAHLRLKDGPAARAEFQSIVDRRGEVPTSVLYTLAHLGLARSATLMNDTKAARDAYERMFSFWKRADSNLLQVKEAQAEYGRLR